MFRQMLRSKIHRATVTDACLEYEGSLTVDETLLEAAGILPYEAVVISNLNNGERFTTYVIPGARGSGAISLTGTGGNGTFRSKLDSSDLTSGATTTTQTSFTPAANLSDGAHVLYVQERDTAGNWSASGSAAIRCWRGPHQTPLTRLRSTTEDSASHRAT